MPVSDTNNNESRSYRSQVDAWLVPVLLLPPVVSLGLTVRALVRANSIDLTWSLLALGVVVLIYGGLVFPMRYLVGEGRLEVRFAPDWLAWAPMVWADYWVVELDPDYRWAVVGGPSRKYLWILSRTPTMDSTQYDAIRARAAQRGYPVEKLVLPGKTLD